MGRTYTSTTGGSVKNKPRGYVYGAKITLPFQKRLITIPIQARVVTVKVAEPTDEKHWAKGLGGTIRRAIECKVVAPGVNEKFYVDNDDMKAIVNITIGSGLGIRQMDIEAIIPDPTIHAFYKVEYAGKNKETGRGQYSVVRGRDRV